MNKIVNLGFDIDSSEIFLNIIQIYNDNEQNSASILIKKILNNMTDKDIADLLKYLKNTHYLNIINRVEVIFRHIISEKNIKQYKNNEEIKNTLYEIFKEFTDLDKINDKLSKKDSYFEINFHKCILELVSFIVQLSDNYVLNNDFFDKIEIFLKRIKKDGLIIGVFKALFFELYDTNENSLKYIESTNIGLNQYNIKQIDSDLYNYLCKLIEFLLKFEPIKEIILELLYFLDKININYEKNISTKNSTCICTFTHIFNSKKIINGIFHLVSEYQKKMNLNSQKKYYLKEDFKEYEKIISSLFHNIQSPGYLFDIREYLKDEKNYKEKICFVEEIIQIISIIKEEKKGDVNKNKIFYQNSIELIEIFYLCNSLNSNLSKDKDYESIFVKYFYFLKQNKFLFSPYLIAIGDHKKTILEYFFDLSVQFGIDNFNKFFNEDNFIKNYILKKNIKEKDYNNDDFNKYLKSLKYRTNEKPIIIYIIETLLFEKEKNPNLEKYLIIFFEEIKKNEKNDIWKKFEKDNEELRLIKASKVSNLTELINYFKNKKNEIKENTTKTESKKNFNNFDISENECQLKKNCLFNKNKSNNSSKLDKMKNINDNVKKKYGNFSEIDLENIILCIKRDILLKECSAYFYDIYFKDRNFENLKALFKFKFEHNPVIKLEDINNKFEKLNRPVKLKNYSNNKYAYPQLYFKPYTSFYNMPTLKISHSYFNKNVIKKPSFPYFLPHYYELKSFIDHEKDKKEFFNEECELIMKTTIICGNLVLKDKMLYFINKNDIKKEYGKNLKYLFSSLADDIREKEKILIIKLKEIEEIITRRFIYDYRACEIFLKNGKSYYFNLYEKDNLNKLYKELDKFKNVKDKIIPNPVKYFKDQNYYKKWIEDEMTTYQYLLYINKFSSRSFNDVNQYPVFPWIFRETSLGSYRDKDKLPKFRDLRYPISVKGKSMEDEEKEEEDLEEAKCFFDASFEENRKYPSHFRLHYSTSGYLLSFLVRSSPYTEEQIRFQNNQFDSPSRQLNSIDEILTILSSSHDNRELIPEYFTSVEYFLNMNYIYFGYRLSDKVLINDVGFQGKYFQSIAQYVYYNRLVLNIKFDLGDLNKPWCLEGNLRINSWIDLIFGYKQWSPKPKRDDLNLFGKYCYNQYINFDRILEKFKIKNYDEKTIKAKIESKKSRIINFGQCPEVLFTNKHKENLLPQMDKGDEKTDDFEALSGGGIYNMFTLEDLEKDTKKNYNIVHFWVSQRENNELNNDFIYFLAFEEKKDVKENNPNELYIFVYEDENEEQKRPKYIINIEEINLFSNKSKYEMKKRNPRRAKTVNEKKNDIKFEESLTLKKDSSTFEALKEIKGEENESKKKEYINYYYYRLSPKNCMFEICCNKRLYFFVGRNIDNSIKVYEIILDKEKEGKLKYNIPMDFFVSCIYKKDKNNFFTGHKNGKIYEWQITYYMDKKYEKIINIEIIRDLIAHKDSMVCCISYIEKHNVLLTSSNDGKLFIRKYYDFELLSVIETNANILKFVYSDYDFLYLLTMSRQNKGKSQNKSKLQVYTLNGLLIESSKEDYYIDIEPMKNGKIFCNTINSNQLGIFGFNEPEGSVEDYNILSTIKSKELDYSKTICDFTLKLKSSLAYILLGNKLYRQKIFDFNCLYKGINKLQFIEEQKRKDIKERKVSMTESNAL